MAFSPDSSTVATSYALFGPNTEVIQIVALWEVASDRLIVEFRGHRSHVQVVTLSPDGMLLASGGRGGTIRLWDVPSGRALGQFKGQQGGILALAFTADGKRLASGGSDTTTLVWDVAAFTAKRNWPVVHLAPGDLEPLWADLRSEDTPKAYRALWKLVAAPKETVPFMKDRLRPKPPNNERIKELLAKLDDDQFRVREKATQELEKLGWEVEAKLRQVLDSQPSAEVRTRVQRLLARLHPSPGQLWSDEQLCALRALQVLEQIGTTEARQVLEMLNESETKAWLAAEAKASLERLAKRPRVSP